MDNALMQDLLKFSEQLKERQRYLERCSGMRKSNAELDATIAETVESIVVQLDSLITKHLATTMYWCPPQWGKKIEAEWRRKKYKWEFENA